jgi:hypothetical protein
MTNSSDPTEDRILPPELTATRFPIPYKLNVGHAERVVFDKARVVLTPTAWEHWRSLTRFEAIKASGYCATWRWYMEKVFTRYKYWFVFDEAYQVPLHLRAIEANQKQATIFPLIECERGDGPPWALMLCVRDQKELEELALRSPAIAWLSMISCGQAPEETWAYFLKPKSLVGGWSR